LLILEPVARYMVLRRLRIRLSEKAVRFCWGETAFFHVKF
jgi:hypothetical protein